MSATPATKYVTKRDGSQEPYNPAKVTQRNRELCRARHGPDGAEIAPRLSEVLDGGWLQVLEAQLPPRLPDGVSTRALDHQAASQARQLAMKEPQLEALAARIIASDVEKQVALRAGAGAAGRPAGTPAYDFAGTDRYSAPFRATVERALAAGLLDGACLDAHSYTYTSFGLLTLLRKYVPKDPAGEPLETPQMMLLRIALALWVPPLGEGSGESAAAIAAMPDAEFAAAVARAVGFYQRLLAPRAASLPTPMCRNSGMRGGNGSSCFLVHAPDDLAGIFDVCKDLALISQAGGGVGLDLSSLRAQGSPIRSSGGRSKGAVSFARVYEVVQNTINQGGVRNGAFVVSLRAHHADVLDFIEAARVLPGRAGAPDLNFALAESDLFHEALAAAAALGGEPLEDGAALPPAARWHLFDPAAAPEVFEAHGDALRAAVAAAVADGRGSRPAGSSRRWSGAATTGRTSTRATSSATSRSPAARSGA